MLFFLASGRGGGGRGLAEINFVPDKNNAGTSTPPPPSFPAPIWYLPISELYESINLTGLSQTQLFFK